MSRTVRAEPTWEDDTDVVIVDELPRPETRPARARRETLPYGALALPSRLVLRVV